MNPGLQQMADHLAKQRRKAISPLDESCSYRGEDNTMCAVGCLIPDELYFADYEGKNGEFLMDEHPELHSHLENLLGTATYRLVEAAQWYHDMGGYSDDIEAFKDKSDEEFSEHIQKAIDKLAGTMHGKR